MAPLKYRVRKCECGMCGQWIVYARSGRLLVRKKSFVTALKEAVKLGDILRKDVHNAMQHGRFN
ncbi:hypothetical protein PBI_ATRAXA_20 [Arthrobacter phage Atraxa]|uniref:Uncharacterized protein n=1 Tax=Arthrobacter phage Atraxa TaxID=2419947 RepID=A0A3G2KDC0_9CAUD|nr:hypothetical protein PP342_gp20 [Arthrobacter phage Atraxa]AYN56973.1 hypothetical protein PBI_ATRAXA_20 [Arthrobacter phage Atraxa]AYN59081.1 hypothetical protein PBI_SPUTNIK_20 [Arthrobacter phage Sputnik]